MKNAGLKQAGYYVFTEFRAPATLIAKIDREYEYDERILRNLTVKLDKFAVAYNIRRFEKHKGVWSPKEIMPNSIKKTPTPEVEEIIL